MSTEVSFPYIFDVGHVAMYVALKVRISNLQASLQARKLRPHLLIELCGF